MYRIIQTLTFNFKNPKILKRKENLISNSARKEDDISDLVVDNVESENTDGVDALLLTSRAPAPVITCS
jgi:hypothetical protein